MMIRRIAGATRNLGAPKGWDPEKDGICSGLPIRDVVDAAGPAMLSAWEPTPPELEAIVLGHPIKLRVLDAVLAGTTVAACDGEAWEACTVVDIVVLPDGASMLVVWGTTPAVVALLAAGHSLYLRIPGTSHPPVMIWVGEEGA
jgi:hypothetical protein